MKHRAPTSSPPRRPSHQLRIIGGTHRRSLLPVPDLAGLRPTPDRVRETLFNWLGQDLAGWRCWDAYAGSGALGLEAASRGAQEVVLVERVASQVQSLRQTVARLKMDRVKVLVGDALAALEQARGQGWDVVFLDPPFAQPDGVPPGLRAAHAATAANGLCYLESDRRWSDELLADSGWQVRRSGKAASVHYLLLDKTES